MKLDIQFLTKRIHLLSTLIFNDDSLEMFKNGMCPCRNKQKFNLGFGLRNLRTIGTSDYRTLTNYLCLPSVVCINVIFKSCCVRVLIKSLTWLVLDNINTFRTRHLFVPIPHQEPDFQSDISLSFLFFFIEWRWEVKVVLLILLSITI